MRTSPNLRSVAVLLFALAVAPTMAAQPPSEPDSLKAKAVRLVERTLDLLRSSRDLDPFISQFVGSSGAKHPCDICPVMAPMTVTAYAFRAVGDTFVFRHRIEERHVRVEHDTAGLLARVYVPYTKWLEVSSLSDSTGGSITRRVHLLAKVLVGGDGRLTMETIEEEKTLCKPMTMAEVSVGMLVGLPSYVAEEFAPRHSGLRYGVGVVRYFHPFPTPNRGNIWLKAGLCLAMWGTRLRQDSITYATETLTLSPVRTPNSDLDHSIIRKFKVHGLEETVRIVALEVPLGVSKRWELARRRMLALDLGGRVGWELMKTRFGGYNMDQLGRDHQIGGVVMQESNGASVEYDTSPEAVLTAGGEQVEFFRNVERDLDGLRPAKGFTASIGIAPSLFFTSKRGGMYRIGLDLSWVKIHRGRGTALDRTYFINNDNDRPALSELAKGGFMPWLSLVLAYQL